MAIKLIFLTTITMIAFAANSVLCRIALVDPDNDPISFTLIRLFSGALILIPVLLRRKTVATVASSHKLYLAPLMLFLYALLFSISYISMEAGTGALILFASVQFTMMTYAYLSGERLKRSELFGVFMAIVGFIYLFLPGATLPPLLSAIMMVGSGIAWGIYSLVGQHVGDPIYATARNFVWTVPLVILLFIIAPFELTLQGWMLAIISGAITSGLGYVLWYIVLKELMTSTAAIVQLSVPVIAMLGGVLFLQEAVHLNLIIASILILGGIFIKAQSRNR